MFEVTSYRKRFDANKVTVLETGGHPYVVRTGINNGQKGFIEEDEIFLNDANTISFGQDTATMFYQEKPYFTGDKIKILIPKDSRFGKKNAQFFLAAMRKTFSCFSWGNSRFHAKHIQDQIIRLPIKNGDIDFVFMEHFIAELQINRVRELEIAHLAELNAYLKVAHLKEYKLTSEESEIIGGGGKHLFLNKRVLLLFDFRSYPTRSAAQKRGSAPRGYSVRYVRNDKCRRGELHIEPCRPIS